jgi:hypothetical protein
LRGWKSSRDGGFETPHPISLSGGGGGECPMAIRFIRSMRGFVSFVPLGGFVSLVSSAAALHQAPKGFGMNQKPVLA